jgi:hypothetical protein
LGFTQRKTQRRPRSPPHNLLVVALDVALLALVAYGGYRCSGWGFHRDAPEDVARSHIWAVSAGTPAVH